MCRIECLINIYWEGTGHLNSNNTDFISTFKYFLLNNKSKFSQLQIRLYNPEQDICLFEINSVPVDLNNDIDLPNYQEFKI